MPEIKNSIPEEQPNLLEQLFDKFTTRAPRHTDDFFEFDLRTASSFLDQNILDLGIHDPKTEMITSGFARRIRSLYKEYWGRYMPVEGIELKDLAAIRPINTNDLGLQAAHPLKNEGLNILSRILSGEVTGLIQDYGYVQSINNLRLIKVRGLGQSMVGKEKRFDNMVKDIAQVKFNGDQAKSWEYLNRYFYCSTLAHETAHVYGGEDLPEFFTEIAARAYQSAILHKFYGPTRPNSPRWIQSTKIYSSLIKKYGADVHKLFFGEAIYSKIKRRILLDAGIREGIRWVSN